jgi:GGDEF domain-containing protein
LRKACRNQHSLEELQVMHSQVSEAIAASRDDSSEKIRQEPPTVRLDEATGLEGFTSAETRIEKCLVEGNRTLVAILVLDQLRALNARFGRGIGDQVMALAAEDLSKEFSNVGQLYRWNGPAFVLVANTKTTQPETLDQKIKVLASRRMEKTVNVENRSIHLKISFSWHLEIAESGASAVSVSRLLDDYVASRLGNGIQG